MTDTPDKPINEGAVHRQKRLRLALRENLKRRKSQSRGRAGSSEADATSTTAMAADPSDNSSRPDASDRD